MLLLELKLGLNFGELIFKPFADSLSSHNLGDRLGDSHAKRTFAR